MAPGQGRRSPQFRSPLPRALLISGAFLLLASGWAEPEAPRWPSSAQSATPVPSPWQFSRDASLSAVTLLARTGTRSTRGQTGVRACPPQRRGWVCACSSPVPRPSCARRLPCHPGTCRPGCARRKEGGRVPISLLVRGGLGTSRFSEVNFRCPITDFMSVTASWPLKGSSSAVSRPETRPRAGSSSPANDPVRPPRALY